MRAHAERAGTVADLKLAEAVASAVDWFGLVLIIEPRAEHLTAVPIFPMDIVGVARRIGIDARHPAASSPATSLSKRCGPLGGERLFRSLDRTTLMGNGWQVRFMHATEFVQEL
jgi:hypothetical protein